MMSVLVDWTRSVSGYTQDTLYTCVIFYIHYIHVMFIYIIYMYDIFKDQVK